MTPYYQVLDELAERIDNAIDYLVDQADDITADPSDHPLNERTRILAKAEGLQVVKDWLEEYR